MTSIYNRTDYVMLPNIQAARALKRQIRQSYFSNWAVGKAEAGEDGLGPRVQIVAAAMLEHLGDGAVTSDIAQPPRVVGAFC